MAWCACARCRPADSCGRCTHCCHTAALLTLSRHAPPPRWIPREVLVERGFEKLINKYDGELAASALGADTRPLTGPVIEGFLADFGLEAEFAVHSRIRGLSGGWVWLVVLGWGASAAGHVVGWPSVFWTQG
jgi:hypothetical protein